MFDTTKNFINRHNVHIVKLQWLEDIWKARNQAEAMSPSFNNEFGNSTLFSPRPCSEDINFQEILLAGFIFIQILATPLFGTKEICSKHG